MTSLPMYRTVPGWRRREELVSHLFSVGRSLPLTSVKVYVCPVNIPMPKEDNIK